jgi:hypothetical protein
VPLFVTTPSLLLEIGIADGWNETKVEWFGAKFQIILLFSNARKSNLEINHAGAISI